MPEIWFISDMYFDHKNIIEFCSRPFKNVNEMNKTLIKNWNLRVKEDDIVFHIGDISLNSKNAKAFIKQLKGNKIFIKGNHDYDNNLKEVLITINDKKLLLTHEPIGSSPSVDINIVGHVHNLWRFKHETRYGEEIRMCNVSVEMWNYMPVNINEVFREYRKWLLLKKAVNDV